MSLGKAMIHARKQKSIARAAALAGEQVTIHSAHILQMPVLVLNASYEPINICGARRALVLVLKGIARTEEEHGLTLHAQRSRIAMPSVIRLLEYRRIPYQTRALSRKTFCCAIATPASTAARRFPPAISRWITSFPVRAVATPPGRIWSPAATAAIAAKATACCTRSTIWRCCAIPVPSRCTPAARSCGCWAGEMTAGENISSFEDHSPQASRVNPCRATSAIALISVADVFRDSGRSRRRFSFPANSRKAMSTS